MISKSKFSTTSLNPVVVTKAQTAPFGNSWDLITTTSTSEVHNTTSSWKCSLHFQHETFDISLLVTDDKHSPILRPLKLNINEVYHWPSGLNLNVNWQIKLKHQHLKGIPKRTYRVRVFCLFVFIYHSEKDTEKSSDVDTGQGIMHIRLSITLCDQLSLVKSHSGASCCSCIAAGGDLSQSWRPFPLSVHILRQGTAP